MFQEIQIKKYDIFRSYFNAILRIPKGGILNSYLVFNLDTISDPIWGPTAE